MEKLSDLEKREKCLFLACAALVELIYEAWEADQRSLGHEEEKAWDSPMKRVNIFCDDDDFIITATNEKGRTFGRPVKSNARQIGDVIRTLQGDDEDGKA